MRERETRFCEVTYSISSNSITQVEYQELGAFLHCPNRVAQYKYSVSALTALVFNMRASTSTCRMQPVESHPLLSE